MISDTLPLQLSLCDVVCMEVILKMDYGQNLPNHGHKSTREAILRLAPVAVMPFSLHAKHRDSFHSHNYHQIAAVSAPGLTLELGNKSIEIPENSAVFIPSGIQHALAAKSKCCVNCIYFRAAVLHTEVMPLSPSRLTDELIAELSKEGLSNHSSQLLSSCLYDQLSQLLDGNLPPATSLPAPLQHISRVYQATPETNQSPNVILAEFGVSERTMRRLARIHFGCTLTEYRKKFRISKAARLLHEGLPVKIVGPEVGFESTSAFYSAFRSVMGMSPREFQLKLLKS